VAAIEEHLSRLDAADAYVAAAHRRLDALREVAVANATSDSWPTVQLGDIAEVVGGVTKDAKRQGDPAYVEVPYLRVANVQRGYLDLREVTTIRVPPAKAEALALRPGDVLFNEGGDRDKLGRGWVWSGEIEGCIHQNHVFRARLKDGFDPRFVSWHGNTFGRQWFEIHGRQTTNLASLNLRTLKSFPVPAPPLEEQRRIVQEVEERLSRIDAMRASIARAQRLSKALRAAILERAFRGQLVPQDPSDEPAEALLARIQAEGA
jgi:type I restriction enzyme S subunit